MADATLATITDLLVSLQREVNDIEVVLSGHRQTLDTHGIDINNLESPPAGVPPNLLTWLLTHSIREVDTILDANLDTLTSTDISHTASIATLTANLTQEINDRTTADTALSGVDSSLQSQITANLATLTQEITDRSTLSVSVSDGLGTVNTRIDTLESNLASTSTTVTSANDTLSAQLATTNAALQTAQTQILLLQGIGVDPLGALASQITTLTTVATDASTAVAQEITDRGNADTVLQSSINTLNASISGLDSGITSEKNARILADSNIASDVAALTSLVGGHGGLIASETAARIAADSTLTTNVATNTTNISTNTTAIATETTNRTNADIALQALVDGHTTSIGTNTTNISTNTASIVGLNSKFGVAKDGSGYVTGWQVNDGLAAAGAFKLKDINNDARLQNPGYVGKYFPPVSVVSFAPPVTYDADWGGGTSNDFHGGDGNDYTRLVKVYATQTVAITGSNFKGVDYSTGGDFNRVGQVLTTFLVDFSGVVNRYLSVWMRIKNNPADAFGRWFPVALADNTMSGARTYEYTRFSRVVQISVTSDKVIEFGLTVLNTQDATIASAANDNIYGGSVTVHAINMVTIA